MRFQNILLASLIGAASAYLIPEGTEDGVYEHYLDSAGSEVHVKIANATSFDDADLGAYTGAPASARLKRQNYDVASCAAGPEMDHGDTDAANADLDRQCDNYPATKPRHNFYAIRGRHVAFFCNFDYFSEHKCSSGSRQYTSRLITERCGWYRPGWTNYAPHQTSYGYHDAGTFCS